MIEHGDCLVLMATMQEASIDAIVTDPPYGLGFMGKSWDHGVPGVPFWTEAIRLLKPGGHLLAFGGTRTYHRLACAIEDAGFEVRDCLMWLYGSGFPKSLDVSKAIDKAAGEQRKVVGTKLGRPGMAKDGSNQSFDSSAVYGSGGILSSDITAPATDAARQWSGWGTALKPAWEPIIVARKPLTGTVAVNVQAHGTGALNVSGCRIAGVVPQVTQGVNSGGSGYRMAKTVQPSHPHDAGRWPANVVLDEEAAAMLDAQSGESGSSGTEVSGEASPHGIYGSREKHGRGQIGKGDYGGASRFFYTAKASSAERHYAGKNTHPTVKPVTLMRWLCRLVTPPGGLVLDPFCGSGSTGIAALAEGFRFVGIEKDAEQVRTSQRRVAGPLFVSQGGNE